MYICLINNSDIGHVHVWKKKLVLILHCFYVKQIRPEGEDQVSSSTKKIVEKEYKPGRLCV